MNIRTETKKDYDEIHTLVKTAFETAQVADGDEQEYVRRLRASDGYLPDLALVAEEKGHLIGQIMFTKFSYNDTALLIAPLCVALEYRSRNVGSALMTHGLEKAKSLGYSSAFLVGNPEYYNRFGFRESTKWGIKNNDGIPDQFVLALELRPGSLETPGVITFPK